MTSSQVERLLFPAGYTGTTLYVFTHNKSIPRDIAELVDSRTRVAHVQDPWQARKIDFYLTRIALNPKSERAAASLGAQIVVLPEGRDWLAGKIAGLLVARDVWVFMATKLGDRP